MSDFENYRGGFQGLPDELIGEIGQQLSDEDLAYFRRLSSRYNEEFQRHHEERESGRIARGMPRRNHGDFMRTRRDFHDLDEVLDYILAEFPAEYKFNSAKYAGEKLAEGIAGFLITQMNLNHPISYLSEDMKWRCLANGILAIKTFANATRMPYEKLATEVMHKLTNEAMQFARRLQVSPQNIEREWSTLTYELLTLSTITGHVSRIRIELGNIERRRRGTSW